MDPQNPPGSGGLAAVVDDLTPQAGGPFEMNAFMMKWSKGAAVAAVAALTLGDDGNYFEITGSAQITSIATKGVGTIIRLRFTGGTGINGIAHSSALITQSGQDIARRAGDVAILIEETVGNWRFLNYIHNGGRPFSNDLFTDDNQVVSSQLDDLDLSGSVNQQVITMTGAGGSITGIDKTGLPDGKVFTFFNTSGNPITFTNDDAASSAFNRLFLAGLQDITILDGESITLYNPLANVAWRMVGAGYALPHASPITNLSLPDWVGTTAHSLGDTVISTINNRVYQECTIAGTTSGSEPTWNTVSGGTTVDGTVTWTARRLDWGKLYNISLTGHQSADLDVETLSGVAQGTELFIQMDEASTFTLRIKGFSTQTIDTAASYGIIKNHNLRLKVNNTITNCDIVSAVGLFYISGHSNAGQTVTGGSENCNFESDIIDPFGAFTFDDLTTIVRKKEYIICASVDGDNSDLDRCRIYKDGAIANFDGQTKAASNNDASIVSATMRLDVGDIIQIRVNSTLTRSTSKARNWYTIKEIA